MIPLNEEHDALLAKIGAVHLNELERLVEAMELAIRANDELLTLHHTFRMQEQLNKLASKAASLGD